ncbi:MAG: TRAP transporter TatT component family protein [Bryobacteraceae bacterium]
MIRRPSIGLVVLLGLFSTGCSVKRFAVNRVGDALASGGSTYESDDDVQLVGSALPFGLKLVESLLAESPRHKGLLLTACQGFATYSYLYVKQDADRLADRDLTAAEKQQARARRLFLRAHRYGYRALETVRAGIGQQMTTDPKGAVLWLKKKSDVPLLYWNAVALGLAISVSKSDAGMIARLPEVEALIGRAMELDESWQQGTLHEFEVTFAGAKPGTTDFARIEKHFQRALELSRGNHAGLYVSYAEAVSIPKQDRPGFEALLQKALAVDPFEHESSRLANLVARDRAEWLLGRIDELILSTETTEQETQ